MTLKAAAASSFRQAMDETMGVMIFFNVLFAGSIAFVDIDDVPTGVKVLAIDGMNPGDPGYPLSLDTN